MSDYEKKYYKYKRKYLKLKQNGSSDNTENIKKMLIEKLTKEYNRYLVVQKIYKLERNPKYGLALERMFLEMSNYKDTNRIDEVFIVLDKNHKIYNQLRKLIKYDFISTNEIQSLIDNIIHFMKEFLNNKVHKVPLKYGNNDYTYYCDEYKVKINSQRIDALKKTIKENKMYNHYSKYDNLLILIALLRYECVINKTQQWTMPLMWYDYLYKNENVRMEGFTSPFNSQLMLLGTDISFFSLFYDTDKYFGSLGDVFNAKFDDIDNKLNNNTGIVFVPPYILTIVDDSIKLILKWVERTKNITYFILCPQKPKVYEYSTTYDKIKESKYRKYYKRLEMNHNNSSRQWYYENTTLTDKKIRFRYGKELNIYILANNNIYKNYKPVYKKLNENNNINKDLEKKSIILANYVKKLSKEYTRYKIVKEIEKMNNGYEWGNILERFLISMSNTKDINRVDEVFVDLELSHTVYQKMISEGNEKRILNINKLANEIHDKIYNFIHKKEYNEVIKYGNINDSFYCDSFEREISKNRHLELSRRSSLSGKSDYYVILIIILLLRYECILARGQNWNIPFLWYNYIHKNYNACIEGFASPLNSQLMLLGSETKFCSLFLDTDKVFGSLGSLFNFDIKKYYDKYTKDDKNKPLTVALNPPYIITIFDMMIDLIDKWFTLIPNLRIFTGLPYWKDAKSLQRLEEHKNLKFRKILKKGDFYYESSMSADVPKIYIRSGYEIFVLANFKKSELEPEYNTMLKKLRPPYENIDM